jgi:hypothetical protein
MSIIEYEKALKYGVRAYKTALQKGRHPYLPVLDEIIQENDILQEKNMGVIRIPLSRVVGTSTRSRTYSFASNFMPILGLKTEFAYKWSALADAQMNEGIRDPIKVYEYLNYYYVIEGNKRVSVMKFYDALEIPAEVIRKIPRKTDDKEIRIYYEFMEFNAVTGINDIWMTEEGNFQKIMEKVMKSKAEKAENDRLNAENPENIGRTDILTAPGSIRDEDISVWTDDDTKNFMSALYKFREAFDAKGGNTLPPIDLM